MLSDLLQEILLDKKYIKFSGDVILVKRYKIKRLNSGVKKLYC